MPELTPQQYEALIMAVITARSESHDLRAIADEHRLNRVSRKRLLDAIDDLCSTISLRLGDALSEQPDNPFDL